MSLSPTRVWRVTQAALVVCGLLPWVLALLPDHRPLLGLAFAPACHQLPERTLHLLGAPMVVCSRCAGIYAGVALGALLPAPPALLPRLRWLIPLSAAPMLLDVALQTAGAYAPWHPSRLLTGAVFGLVVASGCSGALKRAAR